MPESPADKFAREPSLDPIAFGDEIIFGLDPAIHWVSFNNQREQFPEIVVEIVRHWNNRPWLYKLLDRLGYNPMIYHPEQNPKGIYADVRPPRSLEPLHAVLLRAAGVKSTTQAIMFGATPFQRRARIAQEILADIDMRRDTLVAFRRVRSPK